MRAIYTKTRAYSALIALDRPQLDTLIGAELEARVTDLAAVAEERLGNRKLAIELWNQLLEQDPKNSTALENLSRLYEREQRADALAEVLARRVDLLAEAADPATDTGQAGKQMAELLEKRGRLLWDKLNAPEFAREDLTRAHEADPQNLRILHSLRELLAEFGAFGDISKLYEARGEPGPLCDFFTQLADKTDNNDHRKELLRRVADLNLDVLDRPARALKALEALLGMDPKNRAAALRAIEVYRESDKWARLLSTYETILENADMAPPLDDGDRRAIYEDARWLCEEEMGSKTLAFNWASRAFEMAPTDKRAFENFVRLGEQADEWAALASGISRRLEAESDSEGRLVLLRRGLHVARTRLGDAEMIEKLSRQILTSSPEDPDAVSAWKSCLSTAATGRR